jgi:hypothetical protein
MSMTRCLILLAALSVALAGCGGGEHAAPPPPETQPGPKASDQKPNPDKLQPKMLKKRVPDSQGS